MQYIPVKTRVLQPPKDDLFAVLDDAVDDLQERDIVAISSKIVAIGEGRCVPSEGVDKSALIETEADVLIPRDYWGSPLTITRNAFIGTSGIDASNADGHLVLLPEDSFKSAEQIRDHLMNKFSLSELGVLITDSHSTPLRRGATGVSIGFAGFAPLMSHIGEEDLFGREMKIEVTNLVDGLAAGANVVMGETDECQPVAIIRGTPNVRFTEEDFRKEFMVDLSEDTFRVLYQKYLP